ncbi:hypothetical protein [Parachitinimonas caeni]|uniref:Peptidase M10 metallopeptidase domain-containing protein n=1 Tax=Parachitinimonas caeni TaxID=3031301 RepID=A0ABT7E161_9NEIS|nr:hypothetical protein [Parachitinimonas caeni]MDK2126045.1 hypothetical protein [Parachitinimonas caeni]
MKKSNVSVICMAIVTAFTSLQSFAVDKYVDGNVIHPEIARKYYKGDPIKWIEYYDANTNKYETPSGGPVINVFYSRGNEPAGLSASDMPGYISMAANRWSEVCNVKFVRQEYNSGFMPGNLMVTKINKLEYPKMDTKYGGERYLTSPSLSGVLIGFMPWVESSLQRDKEFKVTPWDFLTSWNATKDSKGNLVYTALDNSEAVEEHYDNATWGRRFSDIILKPHKFANLLSRPERMLGIITHELGHTFGLRDIDDKNAGRHQLMASMTPFVRMQDISLCVGLYGRPKHNNDYIYRILNSYESTLDGGQDPKIEIHPVVKQNIKTVGISGESGGFVYRYYPTTNFYVGAKDGNVYYMLNGSSTPVLIGTVDGEFTKALAAKF